MNTAMPIADRAYSLGPSESLLPPIPGRDSPMDLLVGGAQSENAYALVRYRTTQQIYPHIHRLDDESVFVLAGAPTVTVGGTPHTLEPGGYCYMPRGVPHSISSNAPWEGLSISAPGGVYDALTKNLIDIYAAESDPGRLGEQVGAVLLVHGIQVLEGRWVGELSIKQ